MAKTFYTERDIDDLARRGVKSLLVNDEVVLTEMAVERAERLGVRLVREHDTPPSAPVRPYISPPRAKRADTTPASLPQEDLYRRVHAGVVSRLGEELDAALLDSIIRRVLDNLGSK